MKVLKNILYLLVVGIVLALIMVAATMIIQLVMEPFGFSEHTIISVSGTGGTIIAGLLCAIYVKKKKFAKTDVKESLYFSDVLKYLLLVYCLSTVLISGIYGGILSLVYPVEEYISTDITWIDYVFSIVMAPIFEELMFRYGIHNIIKQRFSVKTAIIISSAIFAVIHGYNIAGLIQCLSFALLVTMIYEKTNNILYCILAHAFANAVTAVVNVFNNAGTELWGIPINFDVNGYNFSHPIVYVAAIIITVFCIINLKSKNKKEQKNV